VSRVASPPKVAPLIEISWDHSRLQFDRIHAALAATYWSPRIRRDIVERAARNSLCVGAYESHDGQQLGYARVITDKATFAYLCDVIVFDGHRGKGIGRMIVEAVLAHPELTTVRRHVLATRDAHSLYIPYGYQPVTECNWLEIRMPSAVWQEEEGGSGK